MNDHHHPPGNARAATFMALLASMATALTGILTLILGPAPAITTAEPPSLAALSVATSRPTTAAPERPQPRQRPRPQSGHARLVTDPGRLAVATSGWPTSRQVITRERAAKLVRRVAPSIVNITVRQPDGTTTTGTGIVLRPNGLVITNAHVVAGAAAIRARSLGSQRTYRASLLSADTTNDVAVIQLRGAHDLPVGRFGTTARLRTGDPVASIGNAWGGGRPTINVGPITRLGASIASTTRPPTHSQNAEPEQAASLPTSRIDARRTTTPGPPLTGLIEARNHIQPGESGGPMVDKNGLIVGLNVAYSGHKGHPTGYGYAIPIKQALIIATSMLEER